MLPSLLLLASLAQAGVQPYCRFPALRGDTVVFTAEGDLWKVGVEGGEAVRLTTSPDQETHAALSPDGHWLAFSAAYEGPTDAYVMPLDGGAPRRLSWGAGAEVQGWTPDGRVLYSSRAESTLPDWQLFAVSPEGGQAERLPLAQAAQGSFSPDGVLYFTRYHRQPSQTRRYRGGTAEQLWRYAPGDREATPLTADYPGTSSNPAWSGGRLYFLSDRDGCMNLWSMAPDGSDLRQHTHQRDWELREFAIDGQRVVYRLGADLHLLDLDSGEDRVLPISLPTDLEQEREKWVEDPFDYLTYAAPSPSGDRVVLTARGRVFVAPAGPGRLVEVTHEEGVRYRAARFLPDGRSIVALSDASGELEFWRLPADGLGEPVRLSHDGHVFRREGVPSPDGRWLAFTDKDERLSVLDLETGETREVFRAPLEGTGGMSWSPDGRYLAFQGPQPNGFTRIYLYDTREDRLRAATTDRTDDYSPRFSPDGQWLYFLTDRHLETVVPSPWGPRQPEPYLDRPTEIFALALQRGLRFPFAEPDELHPAPSGDEDSGEGDEEAAPPEVRVDWDGLPERLFRVPVEPGNYSSLSVSGDRLYWMSWEQPGDREGTLLDLAVDWDAEVATYAEGLRGYELSADGKKLLLLKDHAVYLADAGEQAPDPLDDAAVDLSNWTFPLSPREEWRQMLVEAWRLERDYFYDPGMHGLDWEAVLQKYLPLVERVHDRAELSDLVAQMVSELSALHIFVYGGDQREADPQVAVARLGARLRRDEEAGGYRVEHVYRTDPDEPGGLSPLARPGVELGDGDLVLMVDGVSVLDVPDIGALLRGKAGQQVRLRVRTTGGEERDVVVEPLSPAEDADLRYREWEYTRRLRVEQLGEGRIGYVHLRAMGGRDYDQWARDFYPVFNRQGLIVDVRHNRGGNIDSWLLEKLLRRAWFYWQGRVGEPWWNMQYAFRGHLVVLCDAFTASDGEAFTEGVKRLGLGRVIGTRTWGGEIWLSGDNWLVDHGIATAAEYGVYGPEGEWLIEGWGVEPDQVVDNPPHAAFYGADAQLDAAITWLLAEIERDPRPVPPHPPYPDKSHPEPWTPRGGGD